MISRRSMLRGGLTGSALLSLSPCLPGFVARTALAAAPARDGRVLVVIHLDGGNDGINTVVPFGDEGYARHRSALRLAADRLIKIGPGVGLHPAMAGMARLYEAGRLAIVPGVGHPHPSRSHFRSAAIWQTARLDPEEGDRPGLASAWASIPLAPTPPGDPAAVFVGSGALPVALRGRRALATALLRPDDLASVDTEIEGSNSPSDRDDLPAFAARSVRDAYAMAARFSRAKPANAPYPSSPLAERLRTVAHFLKAGLDTRVYYTSQDGYDTHAGQLPTHAALLGALSDALEAFLNDLTTSGLSERVVVLCFSEFGRRVAENDSAGTDHGTAGPVFLAGRPVRPGLIGPPPSLSDLVDGDLRPSTDFRRVYASVLEGWLGLLSRNALGGVFEPLPLFHA